MSTQNEAPISVTIQGYYKGFSMLVTKRDPDVEVAPLIEQSIDIIEQMIGLDFKPSWNTETNKQMEVVKRDVIQRPAATQPAASPVVIKYCSEHDEDMPQAISKSGNTYWAHKNVKGEFCFGSGFKPKKS